MTGGEIVLRCLVEQGVPVGFGIPGALNIHLYDALPSLAGEFRHVLVRHELGGAWMADGFARASNDVGVAFTIPGPGATHAVTGIAGAYTDCSRVLLITSQTETRFRGELRRDLFHGLDQARLFAPITKWRAAVRSVGEIPEVLAEAFYHLRRDRPGPVQVEIPADVFGDDGGNPGLPGRVAPPEPEPDGDALRAAVAALRSARRPLIFAGDGVAHAGASEALGSLAETLRAPVITNVLGKGAVNEEHPWSLGDSNSTPGSAAYGEHDLLLAVGARFVQVDTRWPWFFPPRRLVHLEADAREIGRVYPAEVPLCGSPRRGLERLRDLLATDPGDRTGWDACFAGLKQQSDRREAAPLLAALRTALPRETIMAYDVCVPGFLSRKDWFAYGPYSSFYPGVFVGMGFGLPAGIGAKLARPDRPVCVVAGDGGFQMTMAELGTAVQQGLSLTVVVVNDSGLTLIRRVQDRDFGGRRIEVDLVNPDFVALASAYGIAAERVESPEAAGAAVSRACGRLGVSLVELKIAG